MVLIDQARREEEPPIEAYSLFSGPLFSGKEESLDYSNANILAVGLRGALLFLIGDPLYGLAGGQLLLVAAAAL